MICAQCGKVRFLTCACPPIIDARGAPSTNDGGGNGGYGPTNTYAIAIGRGGGGIGSGEVEKLDNLSLANRLSSLEKQVAELRKEKSEWAIWEEKPGDKLLGYNHVSGDFIHIDNYPTRKGFVVYLQSQISRVELEEVAPTYAEARAFAFKFMGLEDK